MRGTRPVVVTLPAEIDVANADSISGQIATAVACHPKTIIADMTATTFCDSLGVRVLVLAHHHAAAHGTELRLLLPCPGVMRIMEVLGVDAVLPIYQSLEEAMAGGAAEAGTWGTAGPES
jgi:anti-sigma B factor antagonist